ncbi:hypothetical protein ACFTS5_09865 [Nocardia sp. NPDC056952]|uniref:hypothetical protein n=1 Tax=Nocardia sp. NPDC056952 TaxID=3345979 RepID=UPI0036298D75
MANDSDRWWEAPGMSGPTPDPAAQPPADPTILRSPGNPAEQSAPRPQDSRQPAADPQPGANHPGSGQHPIAPPTVFGQQFAPPGTGEQPYGPQPGTGQPWQQSGAGQPGSGQHPFAPPTVVGQPWTGQQAYGPQPGAGHDPYAAQPGSGQQAYGQQPGAGHNPYAAQSGGGQSYASQPGTGQQPYGSQFGSGQFAQQPAYGQQPYGYAPQQYSPPPRRSGGSGAIIAAIAVVVVLVIGVAVAVGFAASSSDESTTSASTSTTTTKSGPLSGTSTAPLAPGSKGVLIASYRVAYDVPSAWTVHSESDTMSFSNATGAIDGRGQATEGADYCPGSVYRAMAAVTSTTETEVAAAAKSVAKIAAAGGYSDPTGGKISAPTSLKTQSGISGQFVETTGPWTPQIPGCTANAYSVYTFGFRNAANTTLVLTILVDRGTTGELTADQAKKMIDSLRLV